MKQRLVTGNSIAEARAVVIRPRVLGVNAAHDASACLLVDGALSVAIAEERLSRQKHQNGFPGRAVDYCLRSAGLAPEQIDCVVLNQHPTQDCEPEVRRLGLGRLVITNPSHHLLHAYYAWAASGFREAAVMVVDGSGYSFGEYDRRSSPLLGPAPKYSEMEEAESLYSFTTAGIQLVSKRWALWEGSDRYCRFASLGHLYSMASQYIFGHWRHAGKTMGLAPFGNPESFPAPMVDLGGPEMRVLTDWVLALPTRSSLPAHQDPVCRDLAAKVQAELEKAMLHLGLALHRQTGHTRLCISGGVGLNAVTNGRILRELPFDEMFVTPAATDVGISIGAAVYGHERIRGDVPHWDHHNEYHGRRYGSDEVSSAIGARRSRLCVERVEDRAEHGARDVAAGLIIGWFEGGSEFGPRALGHRSILADPRSKEVVQRLTAKVKLREPFRPYAASVLAEHAQEYFDLSVQDPFMVIVAPVRATQRERIPAVCHIDGTCRIQTVASSGDGPLRALLQSFMRMTGVPLVLNTSFNVRGEPIVETPGDALECFLATNLDVLYLSDWRITKPRDRDGGVADLVPWLNEGLSLETCSVSAGGVLSDERHFVKTRSGYRVPISSKDAGILRMIDGVQSVAELARSSPLGIAASDVRERFTALQTLGIVSFGHLAPH